MIVPDYWAEASHRFTVAGKARTLRRFGWSDVSHAEALVHAEQRVQEAAAAARAGAKVARRDPKVAYNGAEGLPIREEVVARHDDTVITRNVYGALCLNTPDVLFADVDVEEKTTEYGPFVARLSFLALGAAAGWYWGSGWLFGALCVVGLLFPQALLRRAFGPSSKTLDQRFAAAMQQIHSFSTAHPEWHLRVYRTPMGYRILAMHRTFDANGDEALGFMREIGADPIYQRMCRNQGCFRARVSPKPWRVGVDRLRPRPGIWPINPERLPERARWVSSYEAASQRYAACRFETSLGSEAVADKAEAVRMLHDDYSRAGEALAIA